MFTIIWKQGAYFQELAEWVAGQVNEFMAAGWAVAGDLQVLVKGDVFVVAQPMVRIVVPASQAGG